VLMRGQDITEIGAVEDILERRQNAYPDGRAVLGRDVSGVVKSAFLRSQFCLVMDCDCATRRPFQNGLRQWGQDKQ
jgi:hypothetical protein